jgi:glycosyltransferase involved in cell wall biosynthesis
MPRVDLAGAGTAGAFALARLMARADVVHAHGLRAGALAAALARSLPRSNRPLVVVTLHNAPPGGRWVGVGAQLLGRLAALADRVLVVSSDLAPWIERLGAAPVERALVPVGRVAQPACARDEVRRALGLEPGRPLLVTPARLAPQKGLDLLVGAAARLTRRDPAPLWVVAGEGPERQRIEAAIARTGAPVRLLGVRDDLPDLYQAADLVVGTSRWEGQPIALREAAVLGAAVVATDVGGTGETLLGGALLTRPEAGALADGIGHLLDNPEEIAELGLRARLAAAAFPAEPDMLAQAIRAYTPPPGAGS